MLPGAYTALVTPFAENYDIDFPALARLLAWHEAEGMTGVVVAGTNGEGPSLSAAEKLELFEFAAAHAGSLKVVAGLGTCSLTEAIWLSRRAQEAGAAASLVLPPYYFRGATESGIEAWFRGLLEACSLPCILYNFPQTTGITLSAALVKRLFEYEHLLGVKDSSGDPQSLRAYLSAAPAGRLVFVGEERLLLQNLQAGGSGTISGLANSFPRLIGRQFSERSDALQKLIDQACEALKAHPQPAVHKFVLELKGLPGGCVRPPLEPLSPAAREEVRGFVSAFGL